MDLNVCRQFIKRGLIWINIWSRFAIIFILQDYGFPGYILGLFALFI